MPEDNENKTAQKSSLKLPTVCGAFVGRDWELAELMSFLGDRSAARSIMLVYGPRGVGKSALVHEAARRSYEQQLFETVLWFDRTRISEILLLNNGRGLPLPEAEGIPDVTVLEKAESYEYVHRFFTPQKNDGNSLPPEALSFLEEKLKSQPYLLIVDDFDEYDNLGGNDHGLCEQLARIRSPNKIILTTRLLRHKFEERVFRTLPIGLLDREEVGELAMQCGLGNLDSVQFINDDRIDTIEYLWRESGGLPEFITRFFAPMAEQEGWLIGIDPGWHEAFEYFSAEYLSGREQTKLVAKYKEKYDTNKKECAAQFKRLSDDERCLLFSLILQEEMESLEERDLAQRSGYRLEEFASFHKTLLSLEEKRLVHRRLERIDKGGKTKQSQAETVSRWILLPFTRRFVKNQLFSTPKAEAELYQMQTARWIHFVEDNWVESPHRIEHQFARIYPFFTWCVANQKWDQVMRLGQALGGSLFKTGSYATKPKLRDSLIEICQRTAEVAQKPEIGNWEISVDQWRLLAQLLSDTDDSKSLNLALEYSEKAVRRLEEARKSSSVTDAVRLKWASTACLFAQLSLLNNNWTLANLVF